MEKISLPLARFLCFSVTYGQTLFAFRPFLLVGFRFHEPAQKLIERLAFGSFWHQLSVESAD
jgi:hypothetical protein